ncbi:vegetative cell wall protein gp1-like [Mangifera indica]|uniref:vegetative cell wall protein gp1-like n=1 Tax=Mangifera indica TaxID=29780 RepID=UPI001CFC2F5A|nr:vegetative cell wall protein gp1-like [Mangifera indica]
MAAGQTTPPSPISPLPQQPPSLSVQAPMAATSPAPPLLTPPLPQKPPSLPVEASIVVPPPATPPPNCCDKCMKCWTCLLRTENCFHHFWDYYTACLECDI